MAKARPNPLKTDPTRTKTQRRILQRDLNRRFRELKRQITKLLVEDDVFGLRRPVGNNVWEFLTRDEQLQSFVDWLKSQVSITVLAKSIQTGQIDDDHWLREHITRVFQRGMLRAFDAVRKPVAQGVTLDFFNGTKEQFLLQSFGRPVAIERVKLLASRAFNELQGVTDNMGTQMQRTLVDGFIQGKGPKEIAGDLNRDVENLGRKRAMTIARTEIPRALNEGQLEALEALGVESVGVSVEWSVSGLGRTGKGNPSPCKLCAPLAGMILTTEEAHGMLPRHPNCLCSFIPAGVGEEEEAGRKDTRTKITSAIKRSLSAERPKKKKRTIKQQRKLSRWVGSQKKISKKRPESLV